MAEPPPMLLDAPRPKGSPPTRGGRSETTPRPLVASVPPIPVFRTDAPRWAIEYGQDVDAYLTALIQRTRALEARLAAAGIPE